MSSKADRERFNELFSGEWKFDRSENLDAFYEAQGGAKEQQEEEKQMKPCLKVSVEGETINWLTYETGKYSIDTPFKLGVELEYKDKEENPSIHTKQTTVMNGDSTYEKNESLTASGGKPFETRMSIVNGEMVVETTVDNISAKRFFKRM